MRAEAVSQIVVVLNDDDQVLDGSLAADLVVRPKMNLGYGRGVNRGVSFCPPGNYVLVANPDVELHPGSVAAMCRVLDEQPDVGIVGPTIVQRDGTLYPSQRVFPSVWLAGLHAVLGPWWKSNPATRRYRSVGKDGEPEWVSGACFLIRRSAFESVGGFDERYFMFAEDMALCWRARELGWRVASAPEAVVTHLEGVSRAGASRAMLRAHHRSAMRFEWSTARGGRKLLAPLAIAVLQMRWWAHLLRHPGKK